MFVFGGKAYHVTAAAIGVMGSDKLIPLSAPVQVTAVRQEKPKADPQPVALGGLSGSITFTLTTEDYERMLWILGIHWLWVKYRRTLN